MGLRIEDTKWNTDEIMKWAKNEDNLYREDGLLMIAPEAVKILGKKGVAELNKLSYAIAKVTTEYYDAGNRYKENVSDKAINELRLEKFPLTEIIVRRVKGCNFYEMQVKDGHKILFGVLDDYIYLFEAKEVIVEKSKVVKKIMKKEPLAKGGGVTETGAVMFYNTKGGVNKTSLAEYLVKYYGYYGAEFDSNGVLASLCNTEGKEPLVEYVDVDENFTIPANKKFVFDMGGYKDHRLAYLFNQANLLVVPYSIDDADVDVTMTMIADLFNMHEAGEIDLSFTPILFVPTMFDKKLKSRVKKANESMEQIFNMMPDAIQVDFFPLPYSNAMVLSRDNKCSIWDLYNNPRNYGLVTGKHYKEDAERYDAFLKKIEEYV